MVAVCLLDDSTSVEFARENSLQIKLEMTNNEHKMKASSVEKYVHSFSFRRHQTLKVKMIELAPEGYSSTKRSGQV